MKLHQVAASLLLGPIIIAVLGTTVVAQKADRVVLATVPCASGLYVMDRQGTRQHAALPVMPTFTSAPFLRTATSATVTSCDDWEDVCHAVEFYHKKGCEELGEMDCRCKAHRQYNSCMKDAGCPGYSDQFLLELGCSPWQ